MIYKIKNRVNPVNLVHPVPKRPPRHATSNLLTNLAYVHKVLAFNSFSSRSG